MEIEENISTQNSTKSNQNQQSNNNNNNTNNTASNNKVQQVQKITLDPKAEEMLKKYEKKNPNKRIHI